MSDGKPYLAPSLVKLREEINAAYPHRDHTSDGWIGDASHAARKSDHNPDYSRNEDNGVVRAIDVDKDGIDPNRLVFGAIRDPRTEYVIFNGFIYSRAYSFKKRVYKGQNRHEHHVHISIRHGVAYENHVGPWNVFAPKPTVPAKKTTPAKKAAPAKKSMNQLVNEVIAGKWGQGADRIRKLTAAGYNAKAVQAAVNRRLHH